MRCLDAHCIHLGSNMAVGGTVVDNCLKCPFHGWSFDGKGNCVHIPYLDATPPQQAKTRSYFICEYYGNDDANKLCRYLSNLIIKFYINVASSE